MAKPKSRASKTYRLYRRRQEADFLHYIADISYLTWLVTKIMAMFWSWTSKKEAESHFYGVRMITAEFF